MSPGFFFVHFNLSDFCSRGTAYPRYCFFFLWSRSVVFSALITSFLLAAVLFNFMSLLSYFLTWMPTLFWQKPMRFSDFCLHYRFHFLYRPLFPIFLYTSILVLLVRLTVTLVIPLHTASKLNYVYKVLLHNFCQMSLVWSHFKSKALSLNVCTSYL